MRRAIALCLCLAACPGAKSAQDVARDVVVDVARGVAVADEACAAIVRSPTVTDAAAKSIGETCVSGYKIARSSLLIAEAAVKVWDAAAQKQLACAGARVVEGLALVGGAIKVAGAKVPAEVTSAASSAQILAKLAEGATCK